MNLYIKTVKLKHDMQCSFNHIRIIAVLWCFVKYFIWIRMYFILKMSKIACNLHFMASSNWQKNFWAQVFLFSMYSHFCNGILQQKLQNFLLFGTFPYFSCLAFNSSFHTSSKTIHVGSFCKVDIFYLNWWIFQQQWKMLHHHGKKVY